MPVLVFPLLQNILVFVVLLSMFLVLMVCHASVVVVVFHGTLLSMKLSVVLWCLGCTRCFGACGCMW